MHDSPNSFIQPMSQCCKSSIVSAIKDHASGLRERCNGDLSPTGAATRWAADLADVYVAHWIAGDLPGGGCDK